MIGLKEITTLMQVGYFTGYIDGLANGSKVWVSLQVTELDDTIKKQHEEMEKRIQKLDSSVRKHEVEVQERTKQVSQVQECIVQVHFV